MRRDDNNDGPKRRGLKRRLLYLVKQRRRNYKCKEQGECETAKRQRIEKDEDEKRHGAKKTYRPLATGRCTLMRAPDDRRRTRTGKRPWPRQNGRR